MTGQRRVILVASVLALSGFGLGTQLGRQQASLSETDVINRFADQYASETNRPRTDCLAVPGEGAIWLSVRCGSGDSVHVFDVDRQGRLIVSDNRPSA